MLTIPPWLSQGTTMAVTCPSEVANSSMARESDFGDPEAINSTIASDSGLLRVERFDFELSTLNFELQTLNFKL